MKRIFFVFGVLVGFLFADIDRNISEENIFLRLDTGGHTARIEDVIITKNKDIITASNDKTIRVWDSSTGKEKRKILGEIGKNSGDIYAIALSPSEKYLAVGVLLDSTIDIEGGVIRIYDYQTGKLYTSTPPTN